MSYQPQNEQDDIWQYPNVSSPPTLTKNYNDDYGDAHNDREKEVDVSPPHLLAIPKLKKHEVEMKYGTNSRRGSTNTTTTRGARRTQRPSRARGARSGRGARGARGGRGTTRGTKRSSSSKTKTNGKMVELESPHSFALEVSDNDSSSKTSWSIAKPSQKDEGSPRSFSVTKTGTKLKIIAKRKSKRGKTTATTSTKCPSPEKQSSQSNSFSNSHKNVNQKTITTLDSQVCEKSYNEERRSAINAAKQFLDLESVECSQRLDHDHSPDYDNSDLSVARTSDLEFIDDGSINSDQYEGGFDFEKRPFFQTQTSSPSTPSNEARKRKATPLSKGSSSTSKSSEVSEPVESVKCRLFQSSDDERDIGPSLPKRGVLTSINSSPSQRPNPYLDIDSFRTYEALRQGLSGDPSPPGLPQTQRLTFLEDDNDNDNDREEEKEQHHASLQKTSNKSTAKPKRKKKTRSSSKKRRSKEINSKSSNVQTCGPNIEKSSQFSSSKQNIRNNSNTPHTPSPLSSSASDLGSNTSIPPPPPSNQLQSPPHPPSSPSNRTDNVDFDEFNADSSKVNRASNLNQLLINRTTNWIDAYKAITTPNQFFQIRGVSPQIRKFKRMSASIGSIEKGKELFITYTIEQGKKANASSILSAKESLIFCVTKEGEQPEYNDKAKAQLNGQFYISIPAKFGLRYFFIRTQGER